MWFPGRDRYQFSFDYNFQSRRPSHRRCIALQAGWRGPNCSFGVNFHLHRRVARPSHAHPWTARLKSRWCRPLFGTWPGDDIHPIRNGHRCSWIVLGWSPRLYSGHMLRLQHARLYFAWSRDWRGDRECHWHGAILSAGRWAWLAHAAGRRPDRGEWVPRDPLQYQQHRGHAWQYQLETAWRRNGGVGSRPGSLLFSWVPTSKVWVQIL